MRGGLRGDYKTGGDRPQTKTRNDIYRYIYDASSSVTKQDIANDLHLSLPTVYQKLSAWTGNSAGHLLNNVYAG